ncbi:immune inhibitor A domain-containing protein [Streptomyces sp. NPDC004539]|uniref:immune inhibitor A domain-containing protein n=1 Tax=Streptomyces sp. NPDC004539 TaxID=3154280 RepID=UPI0033A064C2
MTNAPWTFRAAVVGIAFTTVTATFPTLAAAQTADVRPTSVPGTPTTPAHPERAHDLEGPLSRTREAQRQEALEQLISGDTAVDDRDGSRVVRLGGGKSGGKYVELGRERTDRIFTILVEFGDEADTRYGGAPGPLHNRIPQPDRAVNNSKAWEADYDRQHYEDLYYATGDGVESVKKYYEKQSSGRYSIEGEVSDWVKVPYNEARYGTNKCDNCIWDLVRDGLDAWVGQQRAVGRTPAQIQADTARFDQWDRYDHDGDGDFNEPDGYIDHFQIVKAGEGEEAGGGAQGEDAVWSHRWYAYGDGWGTSGPQDNRLGGAAIGDTGIWVGDYTIQPENGGLGVFAHEYGHDLGLPDHYDTSRNGSNSTAFWTVMSAGSWLGTGKDTIGDLPGDMTAWDKLQLGWLDHDTARAATTSTHKLGYAEFNTADKQALVVELPKKRVTAELVAPAQGATQWWSGRGNKLSNTLTRSVDLTDASSATLELDGWYDIEADYDYLYTEVSTNGGADWTALDGTADGTAIPRDTAGKPALTGTSTGYQRLAYPLDAYAGRQIDVRFRYRTDEIVDQKGFAADRITVVADGTPLFSDDAESADSAWTAQGFSRTGDTYTTDHAQYYIAENRQYVSYDRTLKVGPMNFTAAGWVEHFPYQNGLLIWKWDTSQEDNNTSAHPGTGRLLPVDAHPAPLKWSDGELMDNGIQSYDSPFSRYRTDGITLHRRGEPTEIPSRRGNPVFDDRAHTYYDETNPTGGVRVTDTNTRIEILGEAFDGSTITVRVTAAR